MAKRRMETNLCAFFHNEYPESRPYDAKVMQVWFIIALNERGRRAMKHWKRAAVLLTAGVLWAGGSVDCFALPRIQADYRMVDTLPEGKEGSEFISLINDDIEYQVEAGDTLWGIARRFWGSGNRYQEICSRNTDVIFDPGVLMAGDTIRIPSYVYIPKDRFDNGGLTCRESIRIALPEIVDNSYFLTDSIHVPYQPRHIAVSSLPVTNRMGENALTENWEEFVAEVERCSENCQGRVSNLKFEKYGMKEGSDLCGYSFDFDTGEKVMEFALFYRLGVKNMAEVIGVQEKPQETSVKNVVDVTRYIAASFQDYGEKIGAGFVKTTDNVGALDWNYPELHNPFTFAMEECIEYAPDPQQDMPGDYEIRWEEPMLEQLTRSALVELWQLEGDTKEKFQERPLMASDLDVIRRVRCMFYPEGFPYGRKDEADYMPLLVLECNGCWEELRLEGDAALTCGDLGYFRNAEKLELVICTQKDYSFIANMPHLKELSIRAGETVDNVDFLSGLEELRTLELIQDYDYEDGGKPAAFENITDVSQLKSCTQLHYLFLEMPGLRDFSFLESCPQICTMELSGEPEGEPAVPDLELLPNARFIHFYEDSVRFEP